MRPIDELLNILVVHEIGSISCKPIDYTEETAVIGLHIMLVVPLLVFVLQAPFSALSRCTGLDVRPKLIDLVWSVFNVSKVACVHV
jgi:hypothetical protein